MQRPLPARQIGAAKGQPNPRGEDPNTPWPGRAPAPTPAEETAPPSPGFEFSLPGTPRFSDSEGLASSDEAPLAAPEQSDDSAEEDADADQHWRRGPRTRANAQGGAPGGLCAALVASLSDSGSAYKAGPPAHPHNPRPNSGATASGLAPRVSAMSAYEWHGTLSHPPRGLRADCAGAQHTGGPSPRCTKAGSGTAPHPTPYVAAQWKAREGLTAGSSHPLDLWAAATTDAAPRGLAYAQVEQSGAPLPHCTDAGSAVAPCPAPNVAAGWKSREDLSATAKAQVAIPGGRPRTLAAPAVATHKRFPLGAAATAAVSPSARSGAAKAYAKHKGPHISSNVRAFITAALSCTTLPVASLPPQHAREIGWPIPEGFAFPHFRYIALYEHHGCLREAWALRGRPSCSVADRGTALPPSALCYHFRMKVEQFLSVYPHPIHLQTKALFSPPATATAPPCPL